MVIPSFNGLLRTTARVSSIGVAGVVGVSLVAGAALAQGTMVVRPTATPCLTVRAEPRSDGAPLACLVPGSTVASDSAVPFWRRITTASGVRGWSAKKFLGDTTPAVPAPALPDTGAFVIPDSAWLEIHIVDVGQGDGIWITTWDDGIPSNGRFDGRNIVIDGGPDGSDDRNEFLKYVLARAHPGALIDALIVTHPHNDHYPGARGILRHFDVCTYYDPDTPNGIDFDRFLDDVREARCNGAPPVMHRGVANLGTPAWGAELGVDFLWSGPIPDTASGFGSGGTRINNGSVVLKLTYGSQSFLFLGDAEGKERADSPVTPKYAEAAMLADSATAAKLRSTVIKVAHHGSETSSTIPFIRAVDPQFVVVSSGRRSYGGTFLPDASTLLRYCAHNPAIRIHRTDRNDAAEGRTTATDADGDHIVIRTNGRTTQVLGHSSGTAYQPSGCLP